MKNDRSGKNIFLNILYFSYLILLSFPIVSCRGKVRKPLSEVKSDDEKYIAISISAEKIKDLLKTKPKKPVLKKGDEKNNCKKKVVFNEDRNEHARYLPQER